MSTRGSWILRVTALVAAVGLAAGCATAGQPSVGLTSTTSPSTTSPSTTTAPSTPSLTTTSPTTTSPTTPPVDSSISLDGATIEVTYNTGSVAPPWNHSWTVELHGASATLTFRANYTGGEPSWQAGFAVDENAVNAYQKVVQANVTAAGPDKSGETMIGGDGGSYEITTADGQVFSGAIGTNNGSRAEFAALTGAAQALVPVDVWKKVEAQYEAWKKTQK